MPPGTTKDVFFDNPSVGSYALFDRRLNLANAGASPGGMLTFLEVSSMCGIGFELALLLPPLLWLRQRRRR